MALSLTSSGLSPSDLVQKNCTGVDKGEIKRTRAHTDVNKRAMCSARTDRKLTLCFPSDVDEEEEDLSGLHPGALLYRSAALQNFPVMADALAHGADVNWVNATEQSSTPLIQAVSAVRTPLEPPI